MFASINIKKIFAALITGCIFLCSCENDEGDLPGGKRQLGVEEAKDIELIYTVGGKTKTILTAPLMLRVADTAPYYEFPKKLAADFYNDNGIKETRLTAFYGKYKDVADVVYLRDSVKVVNSKSGDTLYCEDLYWMRSRVGREFYTERPVKIRTPTTKLDGIGLEASQDLKSKNLIRARGTMPAPSNGAGLPSL